MIIYLLSHTRPSFINTLRTIRSYNIKITMPNSTMVNELPFPIASGRQNLKKYIYYNLNP